MLTRYFQSIDEIPEPSPSAAHYFDAYYFYLKDEVAIAATTPPLDDGYRRRRTPWDDAARVRALAAATKGAPLKHYRQCR